jgi:hypothetical protein
MKKTFNRLIDQMQGLGNISFGAGRSLVAGVPPSNPQRCANGGNCTNWAIPCNSLNDGNCINYISCANTTNNGAAGCANESSCFSL